MKFMPITPKLDKNKKDLLNRLHYAEGHLKAVSKMVDSDAYCLDIINQNHAVIEALRKINQLILSGHLGVCAWDAVHSKNTSKRKKAISELVKLYSQQ
jgi:CsoR family transcriptional regulator, copper-sensing transcriptional repressor